MILNLYLIFSLQILFDFEADHSQSTDLISSMDFVQVLSNNYEEAHYYYAENWELLRKMALQEGYIHSYQMIPIAPDSAMSIDLILITTYKNQAQFAEREERFQILIERLSGKKLLNDKQPQEFRKVLYNQISKEHSLQVASPR
ncbi:MAG: hypothetical protein AAF616_03005 [Bacteroidota bacterium]